MEIVASLLIGILIGIGCSWLYLTRKSIGNLRIDESDPYDGPYLFLEITKDEGVNYIKKQKFVSLKVVCKNFISQK